MMCNDYLEEIIAYGLAFGEGKNPNQEINLEPYRLRACNLLADEEMH